MKKILIAFIRVYQFLISPLLGNRCRFTPSCSHYMKEAIEQYGVNRGIWLGTKRFVRCGPWCEGGYDPVPKKSSKNGTDHPLQSMFVINFILVKNGY